MLLLKVFAYMTSTISKTFWYWISSAIVIMSVSYFSLGTMQIGIVIAVMYSLGFVFGYAMNDIDQNDFS